MSVLAIVMLVAAAGVAVPGWLPGDRPAATGAVFPLTAGVLLAVAAISAAIDVIAGAGSGSGPSVATASVAAVVAVVAAASGGGPVTELVLRFADRSDGADSVEDTLLRGGRWIGALERVGVSVSLLLGSPEGVAFVLAVKGLARYPELREPAAAERFIIGTFASVLWAAACAGVAVLLRP